MAFDGFGPDTKTLAEIGVNGSEKAVVLQCEQGANVWFDARLGIPTASNISKIVTSTGKESKSQTRWSYVCGLVAERLIGAVENNYSTPAMERGTNLEPRAREWYQFQTGRKVEQVGFVYADDSKQWGCSPDGLCEDRVIEIKCPMHRTMIDYLIGETVPTEYIVQVQFQMWVCGLNLCDFVLFAPEPQIPSVIWEVRADPRLHAAFEDVLPKVVEQIDKTVTAIEQLQEGAL